MSENAFEKTFGGIEKAAEQRIKVNEGDYLDDDGLLVCCKCNTRKQVKIELFGTVRTPYCLCKCEAEKIEAEEAVHKRQEREERIARMRKMGFPESEMCKWTFAADDRANERLSRAALNYVENFAEMRKRGKGLLLFGKVGTGKTFYAACIVNALIDRGIPCMVTNFARLVNTIQGMYEGRQEYIDGLNRFELLVIDDLASERDTEYMNEIVQNIIDCRYRAGLPTIITTNLTSAELKNPANISKQRTYSRLLEMCVPIEVEGKDRRKQRLRDEYKEMHDILGL